MTRIRSPSYPSVSLNQAIDLVSKLHKANRTNIIDRKSAARDIGYSGLTGRSLSMLASMTQFGLISKAGKGDVKVTQTAVDILHAIDPQDKAAAITKAGLSPPLFKELHNRFPHGPPSENAIRSYLIQQGFHDVAIGPAISAFMDTNHLLQNAEVSESHDAGADEAPESAQPVKEPPMQPQPQPQSQTQMVPPQTDRAATAFANVAPDLNKINMDIRGDQVMLSGLLDMKGLLLLEKKIAALKLLMETNYEANDTGGEEDQSVQ